MHSQIPATQRLSKVEFLMEKMELRVWDLPIWSSQCWKGESYAERDLQRSAEGPSEGSAEFEPGFICEEGVYLWPGAKSPAHSHGAGY
jgi:hypothetical protein